MNVPKKLSPIINVVGFENRLNFNLVHFDPQGARTVATATNGAVQLSASWPSLSNAEERHVDGDAFEEASQVAKAKKAKSIEIPTNTTLDLPFPSYKKFAPVPGSALRVDLEALLLALKTISSMMKPEKKKKGEEPVRIDLFVPLSSDHPLEVRSASGDFLVTAIIPNKTTTEVYARAVTPESVSVPETGVKEEISLPQENAEQK